VTSSCASKIAAGTNQYFDSTEPLASEPSGNIDVNVFPNPSSGVFQIYTGDFKGLTGNVEVFNSLGEKVLILAEGETIEENYIINGNNLSGIYSVKISSDNKNIVKRILITRNY
jgi:hypothetical protein